MSGFARVNRASSVSHHHVFSRGIPQNRTVSLYPRFLVEKKIGKMVFEKMLHGVFFLRHVQVESCASISFSGEILQRNIPATIQTPKTSFITSISLFIIASIFLPLSVCDGFVCPGTLLPGGWSVALRAISAPSQPRFVYHDHQHVTSTFACGLRLHVLLLSLATFCSHLQLTNWHHHSLSTTLGNTGCDKDAFFQGREFKLLSTIKSPGDLFPRAKFDFRGIFPKVK